MLIFIIILLISFIFLLFFSFYLLKKNKKIKKEFTEKEKQKLLKTLDELNKEIEKKNGEKKGVQSNLEEQKYYAQQVINELQSRIAENQRHLSQLTEKEKEKIDQEVALYKERELSKTKQDLMQYTENLKKTEQDSLNKFLEYCKEQRLIQEEELTKIKLELEDYRARRGAMNEEILRQRAIEEQTDFYRIILSENAISDISLLLSIRENLKNRENFDKLIYDNYVAKPVLEMTKRVLAGNTPSGIYKITRLKTGEIYIGKSTDVKSRWQQHTKSCFGVGTIAHSILHTTMFKDGIQNFTFELLEEVPKEKLSEREKYWISFYDSKKYGLNEKNG